YVLEIYEKDKDEPIFSLEFSSAAANPMAYTTAGEYKVVLTVYNGDEVIAVKELDITVSSDINNDESKPSDKDDNIDPDSDLDEPIKILKSNYYYKKSDGGNLTIRLANTSGVKTVSAFELVKSVWSYDGNENALVIDSSYFYRFSVGAKLDMKIQYNDLEESDINLQVVNVLPLDVIGGEDGVIDVDTSTMALNSRISLGYDGKILKENASRIVQRVCIDGKKRATTDYILETGRATISLYYTQVLSSLSAGLHYVEIYTTYGKSEVWLNVSNGRKNFPYNVQIDFDSSYPNIFITWDIYNQNAEYFIVEIGNKAYSSKDYPNLFDGNRFDASGKIGYLD
ncbi:MAG: hypothetical protein K2K24_05225, partial [Clostridia bacterium]|nr:hypothetical protein [Clostridia bacterium]